MTTTKESDAKRVAALDEAGHYDVMGGYDALRKMVEEGGFAAVFGALRHIHEEETETVVPGHEVEDAAMSMVIHEAFEKAAALELPLDPADDFVGD